FWGVDPALRYPRFTTRYTPDPAGLQAVDGRRSRTVIAVDVEGMPGARGPADADRRIAIAARDEVATLTATAAIVAGAVRSTTASSHREEHAWRTAGDLAPQLVAARYAAIVVDGECADAAGGGRDRARSSALIALAQALNGPTRCALSTLRAGGNRSGADAALTSQTGYPLAVDFGRGYPRYRPYDGTAGARLARGEVDAAIVIGAE